MHDQNTDPADDPMGTEVHSAFASPTPNLAAMESEQLIEKEQLGAEGPELELGKEREKARSLWQDAWRDLRGNWIFWVSSLVILFLLVVAIWPGLFTSTSPLACNLSDSLQSGSAAHPFGTDNQGCDIYSRTIHGARASITVGFFATLGSLVVGAVLGGLAGFFGGWWDAILSRITDIFFGIPLLLGAMVFLTAINSHSVWIVVAFLVILGWPQIARIARGSVITAKQQDYVTAARALGAGNSRLMLRHILPNAVAPIIVVGTIALGSYISLEATLSFLGVGLAPPTVSWGIDLSNAVQVFRNAPYTLFYPAAALSITVLAFIMLGDAVREALDPKLR